MGVCSCVCVCNTTCISIFVLYNHKPYLEGKEIANLLKMARHMLMGIANDQNGSSFPNLSCHLKLGIVIGQFMARVLLVFHMFLLCYGS